MLLPNIHILGIQGSGKGTQSELLVERYGLTYISSGDLFRKRSAQDDELGLAIRKELAEGRLLKDDLTSHIVEDYLENQPPRVGLLGDGVIRTLQQLQKFSEIWPRRGLDEPVLIHLALSEDVAMQRIARRQQKASQSGDESILRTDDNTEAIVQRFQQYHDLTEPVIEAFERNGRCANISAERSVEEIQADIRTAIEQFYPQLSHVTD